jgi:addiction module HigA family antidote
VNQHPGQFLRFLLFELEMPVAEAAEQTGLSEAQIAGIVEGKIAITREIAGQLAKLGGTTEEMWLRL